jgi:hypothetical protein
MPKPWQEVSVESKQEKENRLPLLILGSPPHALAHHPLAPGLEKIEAKNNFYFLVCAEEEALKSALDGLAQAGIGPEQILILAPEKLLIRFAHDPLMGIFEITAADSDEEIRQRLCARIETQRHRKIAAEIEAARLRGLPSELMAEEWFVRLEVTHLAHAFACAFDLAPASHQACLRGALRGLASDDSPWGSATPLEEIIPLSARLAQQHWRQPAKFREELRRLSVNLSFRTRTDLRSVAERCLESAWKGIPHVA